MEEIKMEEQMTFEFTERPTIKGFPELRWTGKRPYRSTQYFPAQLRERYGEEKDGWINKIFWGDNLQVMSHMLKEFRGKIDLIYIDPPFDSKADYKKKIEVKGVGKAETDSTSFEEKQYGDIWTNDEYLQFMYERFIVLRELMSSSGNIFIHCDWHKSSYLKIICDEVFGINNFVNEIIWKRKGGSSNPSKQLDVAIDTILWYRKTESAIFNAQFSKESQETKQYIEERFNNFDENGRQFMKSPIVSPNYRENLVYEYKGYTPPANGWSISLELMKKWDEDGKLYFPEHGNRIYRKIYLDEYPGQPISNIWTDIYVINPMALERLDYPTQKPEALLERIIKLASNEDSIIFDCFMGSGTTQAVALKLGRRFIGADINLGAIQTTTKRLLRVTDETDNVNDIYTGFEVYNVNNYDFFRNPIEAKNLLIEALEIQPFAQSNVWDGELDGRMVKIMPVNRIATKADLEELKANLPYSTYEKRKAENPRQPVELITIVCMGHEPDLKASLEHSLSEYKVDVQIVDILRDKSELQLKREAEAEIVREGGKLVIRSFYPMNLLQKLSLQKEYVDDWKQLVESIMIDWNYDGVVMQPIVIDIPDKKEFVTGIYDIPEDAGTIKVKITDLLSESLEMEV
jgi:DNA methylase N-4/N-6 domain protein